MSDNKVKALKNRGLGRGLSALIQDTSRKEFSTPATIPANDSEESAKKLSLKSIRPWKLQPRTYIGEDELNELAESIKINGVVQPILVRKSEEGFYEIIAGERRWRASALAGLENIPAIVMQVTDKQALEIALVENIQRQNLMALEVAEGYRRLIEEFDYTQEELSEVVGKSRAQVSNSLRLLALPDEVKALLNSDKISAGHARAILSSDNPTEVANRVVKRGLNVRQTEALVQKLAEFPKAHKLKEKADNIIRIEKALNETGLSVAIQDKGTKGKVVISYNSSGELDAILKRLVRAG